MVAAGALGGGAGLAARPGEGQAVRHQQRARGRAVCNTQRQDGENELGFTLSTEVERVAYPSFRRRPEEQLTAAGHSSLPNTLTWAEYGERRERRERRGRAGVCASREPDRGATERMEYSIR